MNFRGYGVTMIINFEKYKEYSAFKAIFDKLDIPFLPFNLWLENMQGHTPPHIPEKSKSYFASNNIGLNTVS